MRPSITEFKGQYHFLSNFYTAPFVWEGRAWYTSEHAFQAAKAATPEGREFVATARTPAEAKRRGRSIERRPDWDDVRVAIMTEIVGQKFLQNPHLMQWLQDTGDAELIEGNTWRDTFWGVCNGVGENWLGKILMKVRDDAKPNV